MEISSWMEKKKVVVIIPTYNNQKTLQRVIDGVLAHTGNVIIVNDGSTDHTPDILASYSHLQILHLPQNRGKGIALRTGFRQARKSGFEYAVTIDSDGQHFPSDIPVFLHALEEEGKEVLLIGARDMSREDVPGKSSFGNRFSNFWFWFETGIRLTDTQSGYRLYPLRAIPRNLWTAKFELEIEVIVRTAWKGVPVKNVPVRVLYDPNERVTHFRPFRDFTRISILNTILVLVKILWIIPRDLLFFFFTKNIRKL